MKLTFKLSALATALLLGTAAQAITVHTTDFIADGSRSGFNGFENIPNDGTVYTGGAGPYAEGGITVEQIGGDAGNDIWVGYQPGGGEGAFVWYPDGGDFGYTRITLTGGADFANVGFLVASGYFSGGNGAYQLLNNGSPVASGTFTNNAFFSYLGFAGGGFDTILLRDSLSTVGFGDGSANALALDSIEISAVPEPTSTALLALGLAAVGVAARRRRS
jgi:hypothetical protein